MAAIGRATGVAQIGPFHLSGLAGWLVWLFVHLYFLIGCENRLMVMLKWAWSYVTHRRGARLITGAWPFHASQEVDVRVEQATPGGRSRSL